MGRLFVAEGLQGVCGADAIGGGEQLDVRREEAGELGGGDADDGSCGRRATGVGV